MFDDLNPEEKEGLIDLANKVYDDGLKKVSRQPVIVCHCSSGLLMLHYPLLKN